MAIGSRYNPTNYIGMANQADQSGLNSAKGAADLFQRGFDMSVKMDERDRLTSARQEFDAAWMSNDPNAVQRVIAKFPEYAAKIQQSLGVRDDQHRQQVGSMAIQLSGLLESGNVAGAQEYVKQNSHLFDKSGPFSAEGVVNELGAAAADPKRLDAWKSWAQKLSLSTLAPKEIMDYGISQQKLAQQLLLGQERNDINEQRVANQYALGSERAQISRERLNRGTAAEQMYDAWLLLDTPEARAAFLNFVPGSGRGRSPERGEMIGAFNSTSPNARGDAFNILSKATEGEKKQASFAKHIEDNTRNIGRLITDGGVSAARAGTISKALQGGDISNLALDSREQLYVNSLKEVVNAVMRRESGAAISESEWKNAFDRYLPSYGDKAPLTKQKFLQLENIRADAIASAGGIYDAFKYVSEQHGGTGLIEPSAGTKPQASGKQVIDPYTGKTITINTPKTGDVDNGYRYLGGDPSLESSWEKV